MLVNDPERAKKSKLYGQLFFHAPNLDSNKKTSFLLLITFAKNTNGLRALISDRKGAK